MVAVVSHSDIIRLVVAHYLAMPLDVFQRVAVSTASISVLRLGPAYTMVAQINDTSHCPKPKAADTDEEAHAAPHH
jgi:probable phosphoglycerate mutase